MLLKWQQKHASGGHASLLLIFSINCAWLVLFEISVEMQLDSWPSRCLHSQQTKDSVDLPGAMSHNPALGALKLSVALLWMVSKQNTFEPFIDLENGNPTNTQKGQPQLQLHNQYCRGTWISKLPYYSTACVGVPLKARHVETSGNMALNLAALKSEHNHKSVPLTSEGQSLNVHPTLCLGRDLRAIVWMHLIIGF